MNTIIDIHTHHAENGATAIVNYSLSDHAVWHPDQYYSVGIHPWQATEGDALWHELETLCTLPQVVAIGEVGLDKLADGFPDVQIPLFCRQVALSERLKLPLLIHCVKAADELLAVRRQFRPHMAWIWHGFRGKPQQAAQLLRAGFYLSFGERYSEDTLRAVPVERLLLETDESAIPVEELLQRAAHVRQTDVETLRNALLQNVQHLFFKV